VTHLLDTDHITFLQRGSGAEFDELKRNIDLHPPGSVTLSVVSLHEQMLGCQAALSRARTSHDLVHAYALLARVHQSYRNAPILDFDAGAVAVYDDLVARKLKVAKMDLRIAAIALSRGLALVTRNRSDFAKVAGLAIEDWSA
jgi:tRNA(fMet)-specific endonuclease VapC